jgi:hypothetical protein
MEHRETPIWPARFQQIIGTIIFGAMYAIAAFGVSVVISDAIRSAL